MKGLRMWIMTLIEYDQYGNGTVVKSFAKVARDSKVKQGRKAVKGVKKSVPNKTGEEKSLW